MKRLVAQIRNRDRAILERVQAITREETPFLPALRISQATDDEDPAALLEEMEVARGDLVSLLINLSLKDWAPGAIDESEGEITLADEIERHVEFDERSGVSFGMTSSGSCIRARGDTGLRRRPQPIPMKSRGEFKTPGGKLIAMNSSSLTATCAGCGQRRFLSVPRGSAG